MSKLSDQIQNQAYREAARANQRGFARLHRKLDTRDTRIAELLSFIDDHQLTGDLENLESTRRALLRESYMRNRA